MLLGKFGGIGHLSDIHCDKTFLIEAEVDVNLASGTARANVESDSLSDACSKRKSLRRHYEECLDKLIVTKVVNLTSGNTGR